MRDRVAKETYAIRAKYLIGADGGNSKVAADIDLPMQGRMGVGGSINILFKADLTKYVGASSTGFCNPAAMWAVSEWVWSAWCGPGMNG